MKNIIYSQIPVSRSGKRGIRVAEGISVISVVNTNYAASFLAVTILLTADY
jgi:hypothetical protein